MNTFTVAERQCQTAFDMCGETYHAYTSGKDMPILFTNNEELIFVMNVIALSAHKFSNAIRIIAFNVMNNHFHFVICGSSQDIEHFFNLIIVKLRRSIPLASKLKLSLKPITDLTAIRNNIAYTNRNGFVANPEYTPFSYPWGTSKYYFNGIVTPLSSGKVSYRQSRRIFRGRNVILPEEWEITDGFINPTYYCAINLGMSMFRNAHHYFSAISKNVEAYTGIAVDIDDGEFLNDQELFSQVLKIVHSQYNAATIRELTNAQRLDLARMLRNGFRSSNGQIRRVLGLTQYEVDSLFPMGQ